jgi:hypothetical protein
MGKLTKGGGYGIPKVLFRSQKVGIDRYGGGQSACQNKAIQVAGMIGGDYKGLWGKIFYTFHL